MNHFVSFMLLSVLEWAAMAIFMFSLFRFRLGGFIPHIIFLCVAMSYFSYTIRDGLGPYSTSVQIIIYILMLWLMFRVHYFYSIIIGIIGYHAYILFQVPIIFLFEFLGLMNLEEQTGIAEMQILTAVIVYLCSWLMWRYHLGFTFVPTSETKKIKFHRYNILMLIVALGDIVLEGIILKYYIMDRRDLFFYLSLTQIIIMLFFLYYSLKKEQKIY